MLIGLEKEVFCIKKDTKEIILVPENSNIPHDGCGWLIEYRGKPSLNIIDAVYSLLAEEHRNKELLLKYNVEGLCESVMTPSKNIRLAARRRFIKQVVGFNNLYGHQQHRNKESEAVAAVHISVTFPEENKVYNLKGEYSYTKTTNTLFDFADFVKYMDNSFKDEIRNSKRNPGFYQLKEQGRFEYRSLPNTIDLNKLIDVINKYKFKL